MSFQKNTNRGITVIITFKTKNLQVMESQFFVAYRFLETSFDFTTYKILIDSFDAAMYMNYFEYMLLSLPLAKFYFGRSSQLAYSNYIN